MSLRRTLAVLICVAGLGLIAASGCSGEVPEQRDSGPRTLYVSVEGTDTAPGTKASPLGTIQAASSKARAGDTVYIRGGTYDERPVFESTGTAEAPVTYRPQAGETVIVSRGFVVTGVYNHIREITITPGTRERTGTGANAQIFVNGSNNVLEKIVQRDTYGDEPPGWNALVLEGANNTAKGVDFDRTGSVVLAGTGNRVSGGTVHHTGGLIALLGSDSVLENMDLHDSGQVDRSGNAADAINLAGDRITIRNNRIYRLFLRDRAQHPDAIQWWNSANDLVIEGNRLGSRAVSAHGEGDYGHIQFEAGEKATSHRVIVRNNVFLGTHSVFSIRSSPQQVRPGAADNWQIIGNTFADGREIRGDMLANMRRTVIKNNVFSSRQNLQRAPGSVYDYNAYVGHRVNATDGPHSFSVRRPGFRRANFTRRTRFGLRADLRPTHDSPLVGKGAALESLPTDALGIARPNRPTIGAYEYVR